MSVEGWITTAWCGRIIRNKYFSIWHLVRWFQEFDKCKEEILRRGEERIRSALNSRSQIADIGHSFIRDDATVLVHGQSRVVESLLLKASEQKQIHIYVTEGKSHHEDRYQFRCLISYFEFLFLIFFCLSCQSHLLIFISLSTAKLYTDAGLVVTSLPDCAVASIMEQVDFCLVGAEGVMENGGIVNKVMIGHSAFCIAVYSWFRFIYLLLSSLSKQLIFADISAWTK